MKNFRNFETIKKIKESQQAAENFSVSFIVISEEEVKHAIKDLPINKSTISGDIPTKILKQHAQIYYKKLADIFHESIKMGKFPDILKKDEVTPIYKKHDMNDKKNYRPVSTLSNLSKVFEKLIYSQINAYMSDKFPKYLTEFCKNHNTQHALLNMTENWKSNLNKGIKTGAIFMDLSQAFDTLDHSLLKAKLEAYGFDSLSLEFMKNYLTNRKQRCKVGNCFSIWRKITSGVLQGSILGPLLFNIFLSDIFLFAKNSTLCNYADDNTQFPCEKTFDQIINNLQTDFCTLKVWFYDNFLDLNPKKCHFMTLGNGNNLCDFSCDDIIIKNNFSEKILGFTIVNNLDFSENISNISKTANQKLNALFRVSVNMNSDKRTLLTNSFIKSHFTYCPLIWMFCNRKSMKKVNKIQERYLSLMTNNYELSYEELFDLTNQISPHQRCLNSLMTDAYKCLNEISPDIVNDILAVSKHQYNTRQNQTFL